jgi:hypothetical protein
VASFLLVFILLSRRMRWAGDVARMGAGRNLYRVLVGKPEGRRPLARPRRRWEDGIKMDLREIGWEVGVDSPGSGQGPVADCCECGDELSGSGGTDLVTVGWVAVWICPCAFFLF